MGKTPTTVLPVHLHEALSRISSPGNFMISVRISHAAKLELRDIADAENRTISQVVALMIEECLKRRKGSEK